jgi:hypothetical protein
MKHNMNKKAINSILGGTPDTSWRQPAWELLCYTIWRFSDPQSPHVTVLITDFKHYSPTVKCYLEKMSLKSLFCFQTKFVLQKLLKYISKRPLENFVRLAL